MQYTLPLIVLFLGAGAWRAWRRSPAYSLKTSIQFGASVVLMLVAIVALTLWISDSPARSPWVKVVLVILSMLVVFAGFIALASRITEGRVANLPSGVSLCDIHRRRVFPWISRAAGLLALLLAIALLAPSDQSALPAILAAVLLLAATLVLYPLYLKARRFDRGMTALMANAWVHWRYTPEQWQSWAAIQRSWERAKTPVFRWARDWPKLMFPILLLGVFTSVSNDSPGRKMLIFLCCAALVLISSALLTWAARREPERRYRRMLTARREAYMGAEGLYCSGEFSPWILSGNYLVEAAAIHDPPLRLVLKFDTFAGNSASRVARLIPIPEGREADLATLEEQLRGRCPKAAIHLTAPASPVL